MRLFFHAMLGLSVGFVAAGLVYGAARHADAQSDGTLGHRALRDDTPDRKPIEARVPPPLPLAPRYGEQVVPGAVLAWHLTEGTDGAQIELSRDPAFPDDQTRHAVVEGDRLRLPSSVTAGVWFWRLRGREDGITGDRTTPTWMLDVVVPAQPDWG